MIKLFNENKKWKDYIDLKSIEVKISIILAALSILCLVWIRFYDNFELFISDVKTIIIALIGGSLCLIGLSFSGIAIIVSIFSKREIKKIKEINNDLILDRVLSSYVFLSFNLAILFVIYVFLYFIILGNNRMIPYKIFYIICALVIYFTYFNIFYLVALIYNCMKLFFIKNIYDDILDEEKSFYDKANEIRIDFLLSIMIKGNMSQEQFLKVLNQKIDESNYKEKERLKKYFYQVYTGKKEEY